MRYVRIWLAFLKMSWMADMEYRANLVVKIFGDIVWYVVQLSVFEVLFTHTPRIGAWDIQSMRLFMGTLFLVDAVYMIFWQESMDNFGTLIKKGDLDLYLAKPVNSQFMCTFRRISTPFIVNFLLVLAYVTWAMQGLRQDWSAKDLAGYVLLVICGLAMLYAIRFFFAAIQIILHQAGNVGFLFFNVYRIGMRPDTFYPNFLRYFILFVIPVGFVASVPSRSLVEGLDLTYILVGPAMALTMLVLSSFFWKFALKFHSSASS